MSSLILDNPSGLAAQYCQLTTAGPNLAGSAMSVFARAYFRSVLTGGSDRQYIWTGLASGASGASAWKDFFGLSSGMVRLFRADSSGAPSFRAKRGATTLSTNRWYNLVGSDDGVWANVTGLKIYVNGSDDGDSLSSTGAAGGPGQTSGEWAIGSYGSLFPSQYRTDGNIGEIFILNRAAAADEVAAHNQGKWWRDISTISASEVVFEVRFKENESSTDISWSRLSNGLLVGAEGTLEGGAVTGLNVLQDYGPPNRVLDIPFGSTSRMSRTGTRVTAIQNACGVDYATADYVDLAEDSSSGPACENSADTTGGIGVLHCNFGRNSATATGFSISRLSRAGGGGPVYNSQRLTVQINAALLANSYSNVLTDRRTIVEFGDPASVSSSPEVARIGILPEGYLFVQGSGETRTFPNVYVDTSRPRPIFVVLSASAVTVYCDGAVHTASALSAATGDGVRVGAANDTKIGGSAFNSFLGDLYNLRAWDIAANSDQIAELMALEASTYRIPTSAAFFENSSTVNGWLGTRNNNLIKQGLVAHMPFTRFHNGANGGEFINSTSTQYANEGALFAAAMDAFGISKRQRIAIINPFAGDYQLLRLSSPIAAWDTEEEIVAGNIALIEAMRADYGRIIAIWPIVSTGWDATAGLTGATDEEREKLLTSWMNQIRTYVDVIIRRPAELTPADDTQASLDAITLSSGLYGDEKHLNDAGFKKYGTALEQGMLSRKILGALLGSAANTLLLLN